MIRNDFSPAKGELAASSCDFRAEITALCLTPFWAQWEINAGISLGNPSCPSWIKELGLSKVARPRTGVRMRTGLGKHQEELTSNIWNVWKIAFLHKYVKLIPIVYNEGRKQGQAQPELSHVQVTANLVSDILFYFTTASIQHVEEALGSEVHGNRGSSKFAKSKQLQWHLRCPRAAALQITWLHRNVL